MTRPRLPSSPTGYRTVVEQSPQLESEPPPTGAVQFRGNGWKLNLPAAVLVGALSGLGARFWPAQNSAEATASQEQRLEAQRNSEFRQEMRETLRQLEARLSRQEDGLHNYRSLLDDKLKMLDDRLKRIEAK